MPKEITDRVASQAGKVTLQGFGLQNLGGSTTPFPIPENGLEAIWNHLVRYLGGGVARAMGLHSAATAKALGFRAIQFNFVVAANVRAVALWRSLGYAIVGGLLVSQVLTLFTTPIVFIYMDKIGQALSAPSRAKPSRLAVRSG